MEQIASVPFEAAKLFGEKIGGKVFGINEIDFSGGGCIIRHRNLFVIKGFVIFPAVRRNYSAAYGFLRKVVREFFL